MKFSTKVCLVVTALCATAGVVSVVAIKNSKSVADAAVAIKDTVGAYNGGDL